ncbi:MAG: metalloregulator ArsR/SmtB family transcription factor [Candidatus Zixiibacteriota bacterium]
MMNNKQYSKYFKAFGDPSRLKILGFLSSKEMTVNDIVKKMDLSQPTISRHLAILREAEIVVDRRDGQKVYYSINRNSISKCCCSFCDCLEIPVAAGDSKKSKNK